MNNLGRKIKQVMKEKAYKIIWYVCVGIFVGSVLYRLVFSCIWGTPSFDGAMNLQVPLQMLRNGKFMTTYDGGIVLDSRIQTRLPVLLPIYFMWRLFGINSISALAVNALYIMALLFICFAICQELDASKKGTWIIMGILTIVPCFWIFGLGVYGEVPTLVCFLASVLFLIKAKENKKMGRNMALSGFLFSMAFLNKTVILIAVPSFVIVGAYKIIIEKSLNIKKALIWLISFIVPIIMVNIYYLIQVGDLDEYLTMGHNEIFSVGKQAGVVSGYSSTPNIIEKFWHHMKILSNSFHLLNAYVLTALLIVILAAWGYRIVKTKKITYFDIIILTMFSYFGWWLLITPTDKAWYRRIMMGVILLFFVGGIFLEGILRKIRTRNDFFHIGIIVFLFLVSIVHFNTDFATERTVKEDNMELANEIKKIIEENPHAKFYGYAWYQAPIVSFFADETFYNILNHKIENNESYFISDIYSSDKDVDAILRNFDTELCMQNGSGKLYKINEINVDSHEFPPELSSVRKNEIKEKEYNVNEEYCGIIGVSEYEMTNGARWGTTNVELLLNNIDKNRLHINLQVVAYEQMSTQPMIISVMIDNNVVDNIEVLGDGEIDWYMEGEEIEKNGIRDIRLFTNSYIKTSQDNRQLSYLLRGIQFVE